MYSKLRKATKIDSQLDDLPSFYYKALHSQLMKWGAKKDEFSEHHNH